MKEMKTDRRDFLAATMAGGIGSAALAINVGSPGESAKPNYAKLDAVLNKPMFRRELFKEPVIIESVELLRYGRSYLCRVRSKDGAEGISVSHNTMNLLYPIFINKIQPVFIGQDARRLDDLLEKALVFGLNFRLG